MSLAYSFHPVRPGAGDSAWGGRGGARGGGGPAGVDGHAVYVRFGP